MAGHDRRVINEWICEETFKNKVQFGGVTEEGRVPSGDCDHPEKSTQKPFMMVLLLTPSYVQCTIMQWKVPRRRKYHG